MYPGYYGFYWDPTYFLVIIGAVICMIASVRVRSTYNRYSRVRSASGMTGAQAAQAVLHFAGIYDVSVVHVAGNLTDHYDPRSKTLALSDTVYGSDSVAAVGVAAHECGHAIQHQKHYVPLSVRGALVPVANFGSSMSWILILLGLIFNGNSGYYMIMAGAILFFAVVLFQLVTLPVEFNASHRAVEILGQSRIQNDDELVYTKRVLRAAAMTYVAGAAASILQLLRILLLGGRRKD